MDKIQTNECNLNILFLEAKLSSESPQLSQEELGNSLIIIYNSQYLLLLSNDP